MIFLILSILCFISFIIIIIYLIYENKKTKRQIKTIHKKFTENFNASHLWEYIDYLCIEHYTYTRSPEHIEVSFIVEILLKKLNYSLIRDNKKNELILISEDEFKAIQNERKNQ